MQPVLRTTSLKQSLPNSINWFVMPAGKHLYPERMSSDETVPMGVDRIPVWTICGWADVVGGDSERTNWQKEEMLDIVWGPISELCFRPVLL